MKAWRVGVAALLALAIWLAALPVEAQQIIVPMQSRHDKVRVSGFFWLAKPSGTLDLRAFAGIPGFEDGVDLADTLGFTERETGWIIEGNFAAARRHRFVFEFSRLDASAEQSIEFPGFGPVPPFLIATQSDLALREFHAFYNFLFVARPQVEFGMLGGVGWFDAGALVSSNIGRVTATLDQAFPTFGANLLINPKGPVRGYVEISGFPRVTIDDLSGWQLDFVARAEVFVVRSFGLIVGYRRYQLVFEQGGDNVAFDMKWDGFTIGAQARF